MWWSRTSWCVCVCSVTGRHIIIINAGSTKMAVFSSIYCVCVRIAIGNFTTKRKTKPKRNSTHTLDINYLLFHHSMKWNEWNWNVVNRVSHSHSILLQAFSMCVCVCFKFIYSILYSECSGYSYWAVKKKKEKMKGSFLVRVCANKVIIDSQTVTASSRLSSV